MSGYISAALEWHPERMLMPITPTTASADGSGSGSGDAAGSVVDVAIHRLKKRIETGEFSPGHRLPPETVLAHELELSRPSLREAVRALAMAGVLEVRRGDGTFVTDLRPDRLVRAA